MASRKNDSIAQLETDILQDAAGESYLGAEVLEILHELKAVTPSDSQS